MVIAFFGDSFSENEGPNGWPRLVAEHLNAKSYNFSKPGSSLNYSFNQVLHFLKTTHERVDTVIVTVTSKDRVFNSEVSISPRMARRLDGKPLGNDMVTAIESYYAYIYDPVNADCERLKTQYSYAFLTLMFPDIQFVFLPCFDIWHTHNIGSYVVTHPALIDFAILDVDAHNRELAGESDVRENHLSVKQNKDLAKQVVSFIKTYRKGRPHDRRLHITEL